MREDGRKEQLCRRKIVRDGVPCKGLENVWPWLLLAEDDEAAGEDSVAKMVGEATEEVDA